MDNTKKNMVAVIILIGVLFCLSPFKNLLLLTFFMSFLINSLQETIYNFILKKTNKKLNKKILTILIFLIFLIFTVFICFNYIPPLIDELVNIKDELFIFLENSSFNETTHFSQYFDITYYLNYIKENMDTTLKTLLEVKDFTITTIYSLLLTFLFLISKDELKKFNKRFENSKISYYYLFYKKLAKIFIHSFGKVIEVQLIVALINSILSIIGLLILGFPQPLALGLMILVLSLIPVFGVVISLIPLCIIAFKIGGIKKIIEVIILICILHFLESYFLNPKLMADKVHLPIFVTFFLLIIGEKWLGIWGLIIGIPLFTFFIDIIENKEE